MADHTTLGNQIIKSIFCNCLVKFTCISNCNELMGTINIWNYLINYVEKKNRKMCGMLLLASIKNGTSAPVETFDSHPTKKNERTLLETIANCRYFLLKVANTTKLELWNLDTLGRKIRLAHIQILI